MSHIKRLMTEQVSQALSIGVGFIDRILLTAVLYRLWDTMLFEAWAACLALAGLVSLSEFGFNLYFNNRLMAEVEGKNLEAAKRTYFLSNTIFLVSGAAGLLTIVFFLVLAQPQDKTHDIGSTIATIILAAGIALRISVCGAYSLYRANRQYARLVVILALGDILRIVSALLACLLGAKLIAVSVAATLAVTSAQFVYVILDTQRRFPPYRFGFAMVSLLELREALVFSAAFFAQIVPLVILTSLPVLFLANADLRTGLLAGFVLLRTLAGFPRSILQALSVSLAYECGRRLAISDRSGALEVLSQSSRLFAVTSGLSSGLLLAAGQAICSIWTGHFGLFGQGQLVVAVLPMVLTAMSIFAHNVLAATNAPQFAAIGRWIQFALTIMIWTTFPTHDLVLRMLLALSLGEILGFAPFAYYGIARLIPGTSVVFHAKALFFSIISTAMGTGVTGAVFALVEPSSFLSKCAALLLALIACAIIVPWLGLNAVSRRALVIQIHHWRTSK